MFTGSVEVLVLAPWGYCCYPSTLEIFHIKGIAAKILLAAKGLEGLGCPLLQKEGIANFSIA